MELDWLLAPHDYGGGDDDDDDDDDDTTVDRWNDGQQV